MASIISQIILSFLFVSTASAKRFYFDYSDCETACKGAFCMIYSPIPNSFDVSCTEFEFQCRESASPNAVCMHPDAPPIGGQSIWPTFRDQQPIPELHKSSHVTLWIITIISLVSNFLFLAALLMKGIRNYRHRSRYDSIPETANPSPNPSLLSVSLN